MEGEGLKNPVHLIATSEEGKKFYVRAGFRRVKAARMLGWTEIPAIVLPHDLPAAEEAWINVCENLQRENLSTWEVACAIKKMRDDHGIDPSEFARRTGYSEATVRQYLAAVERLPPQVAEGWRRRAIPASLAVRWSNMFPDEALRQMEIYVRMHPKLVGDWKPELRRRHPIRMATAAGLRRMQRIRQEISYCKTLSPREMSLCLAVVDYCTGGKDTIPGVYDETTHRRIRRYRSKESPEDASLKKQIVEADAAEEAETRALREYARDAGILLPATLAERLEAGDEPTLAQVDRLLEEARRLGLPSLPDIRQIARLNGEQAASLLVKTEELVKTARRTSRPEAGQLRAADRVDPRVLSQLKKMRSRKEKDGAIDGMDAVRLLEMMEEKPPTNRS